MVGALQFFHDARLQIGELGAQHPGVGSLGLMGRDHLPISVVAVENVRRQLYIYLVACDLEIREVAAGNGEAGLVILVRVGGRVNVQFRYDLIGSQHIGDVDTFQRGRRIGGVEVVASVIAAAHLGARVRHGDETVEFKITDASGSPSAICPKYR